MKPFSAAWELTRKCNGNCIYCGSDCLNKLDDELQLAESLKLIGDLSKLNIKLINFLGGEVFLKESWFEILKKVREKDIEIFIITNGAIITPERINKLKVISPLGISVSLDGNEYYHNLLRKNAPFNLVLKNIDKLIEEGFNISIITTIIKNNYFLDNLEELYEILRPRKILSWRIQTGIFEGRMKKEFLITPKQQYSLTKWIASKKDNSFILVGDSIGYFCNLDKKIRKDSWQGCTAGLTHFSISYNGDIKGCLALPSDKKFIEGNIQEKSIDKIWNSKNSFSYNRNFKMNDLKGKCKLCRYAPECRGGCKAFNSSIGEVFENKYCNLLFENG